MRELIYAVLANTLDDIEPYDVVHRERNQIYLPEQDVIISFCNDITKKYPSDKAVIVHSEDEAPNLTYLNYYPKEISFEEACRIVKSIFEEFGLMTEVCTDSIVLPKVKERYNEAVDKMDKRYRERIIEKLVSADDCFYPPEEDFLKNWFEMQPRYYSIEYDYNGQKVIVVNDTVYGGWGYYFSAASKYLAITGKSEITQRDVWRDLKLGFWIADQRNAFRGVGGHASSERLQLLNTINFKLNVFEDAFEQNMTRLAEYKRENGHCNPEKREVYRGWNIGYFCQKARVDYKKGSMAQERVQRFDAMGFDWDPLETEWNRRLEQYKRYIAENNGKAYIARRTKYEGENLGAWVETQRKWYAAGKMSEDRYHALKKIAPSFETNPQDS